MNIEEKTNRVKDLFNEQKNVLSELSNKALTSELNIKNVFEALFKIHKMELQKDIVKAIPTSKNK